MLGRCLETEQLPEHQFSPPIYVAPYRCLLNGTWRIFNSRPEPRLGLHCRVCPSLSSVAANASLGRSDLCPRKPLKRPENPTAAQASNFLMMLDRLARSADVNDAMDACMNLSPAGLEILAIDRETLARWPDREVETPLSFRDARLAALDERQPIFSVEGAITVQRDTVSAAARALLPIMAKELWFVGSTGALEENRADELRGDILDQLAQWNGDMDRFSPEPLVFWAWARALQKRILQDEFPSATKVWARPNADVLFAVLSDRGGSAIWCDIRPSTRIETCQDQVRAALDDAIGWLVDRYGPDPSAWVWGEAHALNMGWAPIRSSGIISDLLSLKAPSSGDSYTMIATLFTSDDDRPFAPSGGTNFQAVMSFSEEAGSYFIAPAGQSGHPLSRFYEKPFSHVDAGQIPRDVH